MAFDVAASRAKLLATGLDSGGALGLGRTAALGLDRPLLSWAVAAFGGALVSLGEVLVAVDVVPVSRDVVPVPLMRGGPVTRGVAISLSASRKGACFVLAGLPDGSDSRAGRTCAEVSARAG